MQERAAKAEEEKKKRDESWRLGKTFPYGWSHFILEKEKRDAERIAKEEAEKQRKEKEADTGPANWRAQGTSWL